MSSLPFPPPTAFRYRAFISYSHHDSSWAQWLQRALETYAIPSRLVGLKTEAGVIPARLVPIFRDRDELPSATDLSREVNDVLAQSNNLIVICSPHSAQSHWVDQEVRAFQRLGRTDRIFCVIVDGEPGASAWAGREHDECFAPALRQRLDENGKPTGEHFEPIAADARPHRDGKANVRLKLIAGMLGVDLDDLKHRERRRRRWRWAAVAVAGIALLTLTSALAINAIIARHAAERRQQQAEDLVGYMLGDLDDELRKVNRLDILESVADKTVKYFDALPSADMNDDALAQRAKALLKLGAVQRDQGHIPQALDAFNRALDSTTRLVRNAPNDVEYRRIHAESMTWIGFVDWSQGTVDDALARFIASRTALSELLQSGAQDDTVLDDLGIARNNIGRIFEVKGRLADARREYAAVMDVYTSLSHRQPQKLEWKTETAYAHRNLARIALTDGNLEGAIRESIADRKIKLSVASLDPGNNESREDLAISNASLGKILYQSGELQAAETYLRMAVDEVDELLAVDSSSTDWLGEAGTYNRMLGQVQRARGEVAEAARLDDDAIAHLDILVAKDAGNVRWQAELIRADVERIQCFLAQHRLGPARQAAHSLPETFTQLGPEEDRANALLIAQVELLRGDVAARSKQASNANSAWTAALTVIRPHAAASKDPDVLNAWTSALLRVGKIDEARPTIDVLSHMGYREPDFVASVAAAGIHYQSDSQVANRIAQFVNEESVARTP